MKAVLNTFKKIQLVLNTAELKNSIDPIERVLIGGLNKYNDRP